MDHVGIAVDDIEDVIVRLHVRGAELVGEAVRYGRFHREVLVVPEAARVSRASRWTASRDSVL
jgi:hypothetical protein